MATRTKRIKIGSVELAKALIDKMLEKHGVNYEYVKENPIINGVIWCTHYEWTKEESEEYKKWWFDFFKNNVTPKYSKKFLNHYWTWFDFDCGLKIKEE